MTEQGTGAPARPIWQTIPCPAWCVGNHHDIDGMDARECVSDYGVIPLTTENALIAKVGETLEGELDTVHVALEQRFREVAPRITIYRADGHGYGMTLEEADQLIEHLTRLRRVAQAAAEERS